MSEQKKMSAKEFRAKGYLQEVNRQVLHPLGLALMINVDDDGNEVLDGIWDAREDPEGIHYGLNNPELCSKETGMEAQLKRAHVRAEEDSRKDARVAALGFWIEPVPLVGCDPDGKGVF